MNHHIPQDADGSAAAVGRDAYADLQRRRFVRMAFFGLGSSGLLTACGAGNGSGDADGVAQDATQRSTAAGVAPSPAPAPVAPAPPPTTPSPAPVAPAPAPPAPPPAPTPPPPPRPSGPLPSWVPAPGNVAVLTNSNGKLANTFRSQAAPYYTEFHAAKVANSYGGAGCKNPYWGQWGCAMVFSGGHANTNDNSVFIVEYQQDRIEFKRITDPVPWFGTGTDPDTRYNNAYSNINAVGPAGTPLLDWIEGSQAPSHNLRYGEAANLTGAAAAWNGQPGASHSYAIPVIIGPENGGAVHGTYLKAQNPAVGAPNWQGCFAAHALHLTSTTAAPSTRRWVRHTQRRRDEGFARYKAPVLAQYVPTHNRIYMVHRNNWLGTFWYDVGAGDWVDGTGVPFDFHRADSSGLGTVPIDSDLTPKAYQAETGSLMYVPERNLLVCAFRLGGELWVQWMDVSVPQPTLGGRAQLSQRLAMTNFTWGAGTWCPDNQRIVVAGVNDDRRAAYEIEIPVDLNATWTVTRAPYGNGVEFYPNHDTTYHKFHYDWAVRSIVYFPGATTEGDDTVFVYRPRGT